MKDSGGCAKLKATQLAGQVGSHTGRGKISWLCRRSERAVLECLVPLGQMFLSDRQRRWGTVLSFALFCGRRDPANPTRRAKGWDESGLAPAPSLHTHRSVCSVVTCFQHFISLCCERGSTAKARGTAMLCRCCKASLAHGHCFPSQLFEDYAPNSQRPGTQVRRDLPAFGRRQWERGSAHHGGGMQAS